MRTRLVVLLGTGKTTRLLKLVDEILTIYNQTDVIFTSFSDAAVGEARQRVIDKYEIIG